MAGLLDDFLQDDLADIQDMIEQINTQDQRAEERKRAEVAELKALEKARAVRERERSPLAFREVCQVGWFVYTARVEGVYVSAESSVI